MLHTFWRKVNHLLVLSPLWSVVLYDQERWVAFIRAYIILIQAVEIAFLVFCSYETQTLYLWSWCHSWVEIEFTRNVLITRRSSCTDILPATTAAGLTPAYIQLTRIPESDSPHCGIDMCQTFPTTSVKVSLHKNTYSPDRQKAPYTIKYNRHYHRQGNWGFTIMWRDPLGYGDL